MADINHMISLGIGSPAGIPEFITLGLQPTGEAAVTTSSLGWTVLTHREHWTPARELPHWTPLTDHSHWTLLDQ